MSDRLFDLFDEYAAAYARGERPTAEDFLDRAGPDRDRLAPLLDEFIRRTPVHPPSEDDERHLGLILAEEPPLLSLRVERGMRIDDVVNALIDRLALDPAKRAKVKRYYQRMEGGLLEPRGISKRLRAALGEILGASADAAVSWMAPSATSAAPAFLRRADYLQTAPAAAERPPEVEDEIDRLFMRGD